LVQGYVASVQRARLLAIAISLAGCRPSAIDDSSDADDGSACSSDVMFEGQCFEPIDVAVWKPMAVSDIDADGHADLVVTRPDRRLARFELQGDAFVVADEVQTSLEGPGGIDDIVLADLDGDGQREIVALEFGWAGVYRVKDGLMVEAAAQAELHAYGPRAVGPIDGRELLLAQDGFGYGSVAAYEWKGETLVKTGTVGNAGCWVDRSATGDFDANGLVDAAFGYLKQCMTYPEDGGGLLLVLVHADGTFQTSTWHWPDPFAGVSAGELDGEPGDELLVHTIDGVHVFEGGPDIAALLPNEQLIEHFGRIGNLGGDDHNEMLSPIDGALVVITNPLEHPVVHPFLANGGWPEILVDFNGDRIDDIVIDHGKPNGSTVWVSK
jgi:hypothetical protein